MHSNGSNGNGSRPELEETPIVLVHGLSSGRTLKPLIRALGTRRPVFAPDLPGFGMSDQPIHPLDVPGLADALRRWMLDNQLAPAIVVGVAFGCQVAVDLAAAYPAAVDRLVLVGPTFDPEARTPGRLAMRWARNAPRSSPRLAPTDRPRLPRRRPVAQRAARCARRSRIRSRSKLGGDRGADAGGATRARSPRPRGLDRAGRRADPGLGAGRAAEGRAHDRPQGRDPADRPARPLPGGRI